MNEHVFVLTLVATLVVGGCSGSPRNVGSDTMRQPQDAGNVLVSAATSGPPDGRDVVALRQLRRMARAGQVTAETLRPIALSEVNDRPITPVACQALAAGGPGADRFLLQGVREGNLPLLAALAQVPAPSAEVTAELVSLESAEDDRYWKALYALAVVARGDSDKDWGAELTRYLGPSGDEMLERGPRPFFMTALCYAAPRLKGRPVIEDALWKLATDKNDPGGAWYGLIAYAVVARAPRDPAHIEAIRAMVPPAAEYAYVWAPCVHLALAHLGVQPPSEVEQALRSIGSLGRDDWSPDAIAVLCDVLMDDTMRAAVKRALCSQEHAVKLGAVRFAFAMGPDAQEMLPDLQGLRSDRGSGLAEEARRACVFVAGLNARGLWTLEEDARALGMVPAPGAATGGERQQEGPPRARSQEVRPANVPTPTLTTGEGGEVKIDFGQGIVIEMVLIPRGEFDMGSPVRENEVLEGGLSENEHVHRVRITKPFYMGKYEVAQGVWTLLMGENPSAFPDAQAPAERVTYDDCQEFIARLNKAVPGGGFRLPTEAEWEYACRAGTTTRFSFGDDAAALWDHAWYRPNSRGRTNPVGLKKPNPWGLHDMYGNVSEWCGDWYAPDYYDKSPLEDPPGPAKPARRGSYAGSRVVRGGSWTSAEWACTSTFRNNQWAVRGTDWVGFRLVRDAK